MGRYTFWSASGLYIGSNSNIFLSNLFLIVDDIDIDNHADDSTIYKEHENIEDLITSLQNAAAKLCKWFSDNQMKGNTDKCNFLLSKDESFESLL